jgi:3-oxoacyl-[acyl-carrier protein] reductase
MFNCTRAVIEPMMRMKSGKIVNISSTSGLVGFPGLVDYSASKAGVIGFTMALAKEVSECGINVNAVAPGATETEMVKRLMSKMDRREIYNLKQLSGFGRLAKPEDIAAAVAFLASRDADFITGQVLPVCGLRNIGRS